MFVDFNSDIPIYVQIAESIEDCIIKDIYKENDMIASTTEISVKYKINPATVGKGFNLLVDKGIIYKRRGVGMFVAEGAKTMLVEEGKKKFYKEYIVGLLDQANKLNISCDEVIKMIKEYK